MNLLNLILVFVLIFTSITLIGQQTELPEGFIIKSGTKYEINGVDYSYKELSQIFREAPEFHTLSEKARKQSIVSNVFGGIAVGFIGAGLLTIPDCDGLGCIIPALFIASSFPFGTIGVITRMTSISNKNKSIQRLNAYQEMRKNSFSLHFGATQHGVGLVFKF